MHVEHRAVAAIATVALHLAVLFALVRVTAGVVRPPPQPVSGAITAERLREAGGRQLVEVDIRPGLSADGPFACPGSFYVGVGITADPRTERIILVGDDTPASRAGLLHDDIVLNPEVWALAQREGALLQVLVLRENAKLLIPVRVGRICIE